MKGGFLRIFTPLLERLSLDALIFFRLVSLCFFATISSLPCGHNLLVLIPTYIRIIVAGPPQECTTALM